MRTIILMLLVSSCFAISLDDKPVTWTPNYQNDFVKEVITKSREALTWLAMNPEFERREEWQKKIAITELSILSTALRDVVRYNGAPQAKEIEPILLQRLEEICPTAFVMGEPIIELGNFININVKLFYKHLWIEVTEDELKIGILTLEWAEEILKQKKLQEEM